MRYTPRPGFERDKCPIAMGWIGKRVVSRLDSGWGDVPITGICERPHAINGPREWGWFEFVPDSPSALYSGRDPILAHTTEFELEPARPDNPTADDRQE